ncbi:bifunctional [glutamate--ammonia ligase]-adenylyl-L-tyrosine phosphorylase/[glutamate--ammonia-ligase] adenylyltransferase [Algiphilus sp.]|uniref:bifunctional [glutamate--ammonia ligase]-adenylyl-L-tyrosine phosphorylase/[glutamate--ammonia-ligase] adenylyltransferase n=1 Tax=Algiphilus sp. TaxID=1872431 RepID=UPI0032EFD78A
MNATTPNARTTQLLQRLGEAVEGSDAMLPDEAARILTASRFVTECLERWPLEAVRDALQGLEDPLDPGALMAALLPDGGPEDEEAYLRQLRYLRNRAMVHLAWRAMDGRDDLEATLSGLSGLARQCIGQALQRALRRCTERFGTPRDRSGAEVPCIVLGMGKLGGGELNFSSDVDLLLFYGAAGQCDGTAETANEQYFAQVVRLLTRYLAEPTPNGFCFRVDWALRPFGGSGPAAMHFAAAEDYYQSHGREWERYAMIKADVVAGDQAAGRRFLDMLQPFVYRRYLDYTAIESLRDLKRRIAEDAARRRQRDNIKLGRGGIRDLEFVVQAFQLIRGGQETSLRGRSLRTTLAALGTGGHLPADQVAALDAAYVLLRRVENALQMRADQQTHALPENAEERAAVAAALDSDWDAMMQSLNAAREHVASAFDDLFADPEAGQEEGAHGLEAVERLWQSDLTAAAAAEQLQPHFSEDDALRATQAVERLRQSKLVRDMRELSQTRLMELISRLFDESSEVAAPGKALVRAMEVIERLAGRSTYVSLLRESASARGQLLRLCMASPWITHLLAQQPMLLDQLLDSRALYEPPDRDAMSAELARRLDAMSASDLEGRMNLLRRFRQEIMLRVAAADRLAELPLPKVSDRLTWLAETILEATIEEVWREMRAEYGSPRRADGSEAGFAVIGYGKLGGIEMGYGSDLDVVFLHDCDDQDGDTVEGRRSVANAVWFSRFAQRLVHWLSTQTAAGRAYEVDLQLRPSGSAGLLVTSLDSFTHYQRNKAWTWEHQALVRARHVCGDSGIGEGFRQLRHELLCREREPAQLAGEIVAMRDKMRQHLDKSSDSHWDLKQGAGGLADLEFATQFLVLRHAAHHPGLTEWSDQWRQTDALVEAGILEGGQAEAAIGAYRELRALVHERALDEAEGLVPVGTAEEARRSVQALWQLCTEAAAPRDAS